MKCSECKFADNDYPDSDHGTCQIKLPSWVQQREGDLGRTVYLGEWSNDECDLGQSKEVSHAKS